MPNSAEDMCKIFERLVPVCKTNCVRLAVFLILQLLVNHLFVGFPVEQVQRFFEPVTKRIGASKMEAP